MIRTLVLTVGLAITVFWPEAPALGQEPTCTTWTGTLDAKGTKLRLEIDIIETEGKLTGELRSLDQGNAKLKAADVTMDDETLSFSVPQVGAKFSGKLDEEGAVAKGTFQQGGASLSLTLSKSTVRPVVPKPETTETLKEAWVGKLNMGVLEPVMQFRIVTKGTGETAAYFDSITEGRTGFDATWSIDGDTLKFDVAKIKLTYRGTLNEARDSADGTWSQGGRDLELTLKKQATEYDNVNVWENRPQRPIAPFPYDIEEVKFDNESDDLTLAGTLTIPQKAGRHPAVILISGSGPQDRDESLMGHKPFLVLADYLTRRGIAVLRYDDRGTAASTGDFDRATTEDFARDTSAAVEFLKNHSRINPQEIGLAGHSEGGLVAPMVVGLRDDVALVVLLAATGVDGRTISVSQSEAMMRVAGMDDPTIEAELSVLRAALDAVVNAGSDADLARDLEQAVETALRAKAESDNEATEKEIEAATRILKNKLSSRWMRFFLSYDPRPALTAIKCPVLAITGSKDVQVLPDLNVPEIKKALTDGGNKEFEIVELENLNHLFQKCETGAMTEYATIQETFNPAALARIGDWIVEHTTPIE